VFLLIKLFFLKEKFDLVGSDFYIDKFISIRYNEIKISKAEIALESKGEDGFTWFRYGLHLISVRFATQSKPQPKRKPR